MINLLTININIGAVGCYGLVSTAYFTPVFSTGSSNVRTAIAVTDSSPVS